jgi:hypothetical protein
MQSLQLNSYSKDRKIVCNGVSMPDSLDYTVF